MGQLGAQPPRSLTRWNTENLEEHVAQAAKLAKKHGISADAVATLRLAAVLADINNTMTEDGDNRDEQAGGFGDLVSRLTDVLDRHLEGICDALPSAAEAIEQVAVVMGTNANGEVFDKLATAVRDNTIGDAIDRLARAVENHGSGK